MKMNSERKEIGYNIFIANLMTERKHVQYVGLILNELLNKVERMTEKGKVGCARSILMTIKRYFGVIYTETKSQEVRQYLTEKLEKVEKKLEKKIEEIFGSDEKEVKEL